MAKRFSGVLLAMALVAAACGDSGGAPLIDPTSTTASPVTTSAVSDLPATGVAPDYVLVDEDPESPVSLVVGFADNPEGLESMVVLGDKLPSDRPPEGILLYFADESNPLDMGFDEAGRLEWMIAPDGSEIRVLSYEGTQATVVAAGPDGTGEVVTVEVPEIDPDLLLDTYAAGAGVNAVAAAYAADEPGGRRSELPTVLVTATGSYSVSVTDGGPAASDVFLKPGECTIPEMDDVAGISKGRFVTCSTAISSDEVIVRTTVDVWDFYGLDLPTFDPVSKDECVANTFILLVVSLVMLATGISSGVLALFAAGIPGIGWVVALLGAGAAVTSTAISGFLYWVAKEGCIKAEFHGDELRRDVEQRLQDIEATVTYTPILLSDAVPYAATADPSQLVFKPFATDRLDPITVSVATVSPDDDTTGDAGMVFRGEGTVTHTSLRSADGVTFECKETGPMELVLLPDGSGTFTYFVGIGMEIGDNDTVTCLQRAGNQYVVTHDAEAGSFSVLPVFSEASTPSFTPEQRDFSARLDSWGVGGTWTVDRAEGGGSSIFSTTSADGSASITDTTQFSFELCRPSAC